jgi:hypothetical protein
MLKGKKSGNRDNLIFPALHSCNKLKVEKGIISKECEPMHLNNRGLLLNNGLPKGTSSVAASEY